MSCLAIIGASGHGKVVADCAESSGWSKIDFYDDALPIPNVNGVWGVIGDTQSLLNNISKYDGIIIAIGNNDVRLKKYNELLACGAPLVSIVHSSALISPYAVLGSGSAVMAGAVINTDTKIGVCCIVNTGATIDHDCIVSDGVHISPGANIGGGVVIGKCSWVGIGASVCQLIKVGDNSIVGAGAVVIRNVAKRSIVAGVPAKLLSGNI